MAMPAGFVSLLLARSFAASSRATDPGCRDTEPDATGIGEYGFTTVAWEAFGAVPEATRAQYLTEAFALAAQTGYVDGFCWFYPYTTPWNPASWALLLGSYPNFQPTQTFEALVAVPNG